MGHTASTRRVTLPHLHRDRHGTFYFRVTRGGKTIRKSLRTKDPALASILAAKINWEWSMNWEWWRKKRPDEPSAEEKLAAIEADIQKLNMTVDRDGSVSFTDIQSDEDVRRARELFSRSPKSAQAPTTISRSFDRSQGRLHHPRPPPCHRRRPCPSQRGLRNTLSRK
ncbi:hypothetical protein [Roseateles chitinivorans]|uniref:hypothetical protein n=1 Tax=Roseateles chitinivorans TaxID=2917965 RepID=UPI0013041D6F|nr:hypothetical protein [Roseateles chitinivorans]